MEALLTPSFGDVLDVFAGAAIMLPNMGDTGIPLDTLVVVNDGQQEKMLPTGLADLKRLCETLDHSPLLWMEEILHQLIGSLSHYL